MEGRFAVLEQYNGYSYSLSVEEQNVGSSISTPFLHKLTDFEIPGRKQYIVNQKLMTRDEKRIVRIQYPYNAWVLLFHMALNTVKKKKADDEEIFALRVAAIDSLLFYMYNFLLQQEDLKQFNNVFHEIPQLHVSIGHKDKSEILNHLWIRIGDKCTYPKKLVSNTIFQQYYLYPTLFFNNIICI